MPYNIENWNSSENLMLNGYENIPQKLVFCESYEAVT